jgi:uncharacterized protein DUF4242
MHKYRKFLFYTFNNIVMPIFLDVHKVPFKEENLRELVGAPMDEYGVSHVNLFYNKEAGVCFCLLEAPDTEAVIKHHDKVNVECEWITEVTMAKTDQHVSTLDKDK